MTNKISLFHWLLDEWRYTPFVSGSIVFLMLGSFFYLSGALSPVNYPWYFSSITEYQGMVLLLILAPSYICLIQVFGRRRSIELARIVNTADGTELSNTVSSAHIPALVAAGVTGWMYAVLFNVPGYGLNLLAVDQVERSIILGQMLIWAIMGCFLAYRIRIARAFHHAGKFVSIDIFETASLKPFAQIGLIDVLTIVGGLLISTVQSLDFSFRPDNYYKALAVLLPAMLYLAIYPMLSVHKRMVQLRDNELRALNKTISSAAKDLRPDSIKQLEVMLQRRERVQNLSVWPVDTSIIQRLVLYLVIPPLAWVGAALVELALGGFIQS